MENNTMLEGISGQHYADLNWNVRHCLEILKGLEQFKSTLSQDCFLIGLTDGIRKGLIQAVRNIDDMAKLHFAKSSLTACTENGHSNLDTGSTIPEPSLSNAGEAGRNTTRKATLIQNAGELLEMLRKGEW